MIEVNMTDKDLAKAKEQAMEMGNIAHSITEGQGSVAGFLSEIAVANYYGATQANTYDYDLVMPDGTTIDVKAKRTTAVPRSYYECSVAAYNTSQACDYYSFCRVSSNLRTVWLLGTIKKAEYFDKAEKRLKGEVDYRNNFTFKADCYNLRISQLPPLSTVVSVLN